MWWHYVSVGVVVATFVVVVCFLSYFFEEEPSNSDELGYSFGPIDLVRHIFKAATPVSCTVSLLHCFFVALSVYVYLDYYILITNKC